MKLEHRTVETNGIRMHFVEAGSGFPVVLCHGFPELWYSWRHQIPALAEAGFRVIVPDQRGYGETDAPDGADAYTIHHLVADVTGLLDALSIERAVWVGHDWGGVVVWQAALLARDRVAGVAGVNTPFLPRSPVSPLELMRAAARGGFHYILYFQEPGVAERELERDVRRTLRGFYQPADPALVTELRKSPSGVLGSSGGGMLDRLPDRPHGDFLSAEDFEVFARAFERTGFGPGLQWYRNFGRNWELTGYLNGAKMSQPALMITAELDFVLRPEMAKGMKAWVPNLRKTVLVRGSGHWTQQEKPAEVNAALLEFLDEFRGETV
ncbi:MAG: soluble epoxide hydrolase / lipid-phosphate phosphatase [Candidatus Binatota bacterium]|jgi:pimeloyl-ACP methyl ester carboxylesterase|nr:soluble epoxide hydrolase / lipid-phosphate phosphatase [Candidatus Binatota bacterium]